MRKIIRTIRFAKLDVSIWLFNIKTKIRVWKFKFQTQMETRKFKKKMRKYARVISKFPSIDEM